MDDQLARAGQKIAGYDANRLLNAATDEFNFGSRNGPSQLAASSSLGPFTWTQEMLTFDNEFASDGACGCLLWADGPSVKRVRFSIGQMILQDLLHGGNPVHDQNNVALCERERPRIEDACRRAFAKAFQQLLISP